MQVGKGFTLSGAENDYRISRYHEFVGRHGLTDSFNSWAFEMRIHTTPVLTVLLTTFLAIVPTITIAVCTEDSPSWLRNYDGTIGEKYRVRMTLSIASGQVEGVYFYSTQLKDIEIKGRITDGTQIVLDELDSTGKATARFHGEFPERDPRGRYGSSKLQCEVIVGSWRKLDSAQELPVYLSLESATASTFGNRYAAAGAQSDELVHRRARQFWDAVKRGDQVTVASLIRYPITVAVPSGAKLIRGPKELIANYKAIFSPRYREAISNALPRNMFVREQGIMLGNGEVWFGPDGKVVALNNY